MLPARVLTRHVVLVSALSVAIPALFLGGLLGLHSRLELGARRSFARGVGVAAGCLGAMLGVIDARGLELSLGLTSIGSWWWALLFTGLTLMGLATLSKGIFWLLGASVLASSIFGWVSLLTDPAFSGVLLPVRPVHVAFAAIFCASSIAWGLMLFVRAEPANFRE